MRELRALASLLYGIARLVGWLAALSGGLGSTGKRVRNRAILGKIGPWLRK